MHSRLRSQSFHDHDALPCRAIEQPETPRQLVRIEWNAAQHLAKWMVNAALMHDRNAEPLLHREDHGLKAVELQDRPQNDAARMQIFLYQAAAPDASVKADIGLRFSSA